MQRRKKAMDAIKTDAQLTEEEGKTPEKPGDTEKPSDPNTPQTGDSGIIIALTAIFVLTLSGFAAVTVYREKTQLSTDRVKSRSNAPGFCFVSAVYFSETFLRL